MSIKSSIKSLRRFPKLYAEILNNFRSGYGFHEDEGIKQVVFRILDAKPITAFVETGTSRGDTSYLLANKYPKLPIYTCEIDPGLYRLSRERLKHLDNVTIYFKSSEEFILENKDQFGDLPFFFLDAHDFGDNPLVKEIEIIKQNFQKAVILIDDITLIGEGRNALSQIWPLLGEYAVIQRTPPSKTGYLLSYKGI